MDYIEVNLEQKNLLKKMKELNESLSLAELRWSTAELMAKAEEDKKFLEIKASDSKITDSTAKAKARDLAYPKYAGAIIKESSYKKLKREWELLEKQWNKLLIDASQAKEEFKRFEKEII